MIRFRRANLANMGAHEATRSAALWVHRHVTLGLLALAVFGAVACGSRTDAVPRAPLTTTTSGTSNDGGVQAVQLDGVWIFQHRPSGGNDALHGGSPAIVDGCLRVGGAVVVWHVDHLDRAEAAIAAARRGDAEPLSIGGGGLSLAEGGQLGQIPESIRELCPIDEVWVQAP